MPVPAPKWALPNATASVEINAQAVASCVQTVVLIAITVFSQVYTSRLCQHVESEKAR